jgi:ribosomal protein S18 acetylase RimI-like enzyme
MPLAIRPAQPEEFTAVGEVCVAAYTALGVSGRYAAVLRDVAARAAAAEVMVADDEGLLGTVTYVPGGGPLREIARPEEAEFRMLAVAPEAQGRGIGLALAEHVVAESRRRGRAGVACSSQRDMHAAHRIYERLGFGRDPSRDWSPVPGVDLLAFALVF